MGRTVSVVHHFTRSSSSSSSSNILNQEEPAEDHPRSRCPQMSMDTDCIENICCCKR